MSEAVEGRIDPPPKAPPELRSVEGGLTGDAPDGAPRAEGRRADDPARILVLCNYDPLNAATVSDHINSFHKYSRHQVAIYSKIGELPADFSFDPFDVVVIHYSVFIAVDAYVAPRTRHALARFRGLKILFVQDEYRFVDRTIAAIVECGVKVVFTCVPTSEIPKVYSPERCPGVRFVNVLTGYVANGLKLFPPKPLADRPVMVGYRGRVYPAWHGSAGREKFEIGRRFLEDARRYKLVCDIDWREKSRVYGLDWVNFIRNCWAVLSVESGASVFDFDGWISARTESFVRVLGLSGERSARVKAMLSQLGALGAEPQDRQLYEELRRRFFTEKEDLIDLAQLSPRVFEATTLQTLLIMYEGRYSGALEPWRHYVPLKKDHSNMPEVVTALRDPARVADIIATAYAEISENERYSFATFVRLFDATVEEEMKPAMRSAVAVFHRDEFYKTRPFSPVDNPHAFGGRRARVNRVTLVRIARAIARRILDSR